MLSFRHAVRQAYLSSLLAAAAFGQAQLQPVELSTGPLLILQQADDGGAAAGEWLVADLAGERRARTFLFGAASFVPVRRIDHAHLIAQVGDRLAVLDLRRGTERSLAGRSVLGLYGGAVRMSSGPDRAGTILEQPWSSTGSARVLCELELTDLHIDGDSAFGIDPVAGDIVQTSLEDSSLRRLGAVPGVAPRFALSPNRSLLAVGTLELPEGKGGPGRNGWVTVIDLARRKVVCQWEAPPGSFQLAMYVRWNGDDEVRYALATGRGWNIPLQCVSRDVRTAEVTARHDTKDTVAPLRDRDPLSAHPLSDRWPQDADYGAFRVRSGILLRGADVLARKGHDRVTLVDDTHAMLSKANAGPTEVLDAVTNRRRRLSDTVPRRVFLLGGVR